MKRLIEGKSVKKVMILLIIIITILYFFNGYKGIKTNTTKAIKSLTKSQPKPKRKINLIKYNQFNYRKIEKGTRLLLEINNKEWSGFIDVSYYGMTYDIRSINGKSHMIKYKDGSVDVFLIADKKPPKDPVFQLKSKSGKDTLLIRTW